MGVIRATTSFADGVMGELVVRVAGIANEGSRGHRCLASAGFISAPRLMLVRSSPGRMPASRSKDLRVIPRGLFSTSDQVPAGFPVILARRDFGEGL